MRTAFSDIPYKVIITAIYGISYLGMFASAAGLSHYIHAWTGWTLFFCWVLAAILVLAFRFNLVIGILGYVGSHYVWHWPLIFCILLFSFFCANAFLSFMTVLGLKREYSLKRNVLQLEEMIEEHRKSADDK